MGAPLEASFLGEEAHASQRFRGSQISGIGGRPSFPVVPQEHGLMTATSRAGERAPLRAGKESGSRRSGFSITLFGVGTVGCFGIMARSKSWPSRGRRRDSEQVAETRGGTRKEPI